MTGFTLPGLVNVYKNDGKIHHAINGKTHCQSVGLLVYPPHLVRWWTFQPRLIARGYDWGKLEWSKRRNKRTGVQKIGKHVGTTRTGKKQDSKIGMFQRRKRDMNEKCLLLGFEMIKLDKTTGEERRLTSKKKDVWPTTHFVLISGSLTIQRNVFFINNSGDMEQTHTSTAWVAGRIIAT